MAKLHVEIDGYVALEFGRQEVERGDISEASIVIKDLYSSKEKSLKYQGKLNLKFDGYNEDSREIYEIPEIVQWLQKLDRLQIPWFWLVNTSSGSQNLLILLSCILIRRD